MPKKKIKTTQKKRNKFRILIYIFILFLVGFFIYKNSQSENGRIASQDALQLGVYNPFESKENPKSSDTNKAAPPVDKNPNLPEEPEFPNACNHDNGKQAQPGCECRRILLECSNNKCVRVIPEKDHPKMGYMTCDQVDAAGLCGENFTGGDTGIYCVGKPIIYLYPEVPTLVDVQIETIGNIFISDPQIEQLSGPALSEFREGWKDVLAYPNGNLVYEAKQYRELFYETDVEDFQKPTNGINIPKGKIEEELARILTQLGLDRWERSEFLEYWVPILKNQDKPYIQFSLIQGKAKEEIDKVIIEPQPNTFIEILAYFKPLNKPFQGPTLILPSEPPKRIGFTAVEWGGVVDDK